MNNNRQAPSGPEITLNDVYYVIFRHKWKIVVTSILGLLAAAAIYHLKAPMYESEAELLIKYVPEVTQMGLADENQKVIVPDSDGEDVINSEIQILTSLDVAEDAASNFGPSTILAKMGGGNNANWAASFIRANLQAESPDSRSSVIIVTLKHPDPRVVQPLLQEVINAYLQKHYEIHSAGGQFEDALTMEQSTLSVQLSATEQEIADLKNKAHIISLDDSQNDLSQQLSKLNDEILDAKVELTGDEAAMKQTGASQPLELQTTNPLSAIPQDRMDEYADVCANLGSFRKKEQDYLMQGFTRSNSLLQEVAGEIASNEKSKEDLEKRYPQIAGMAPVLASTGPATGTASGGRPDIAQILALKAKIQAWESQLGKLQVQATNLNNLAPTITQLQETESILEANYKNLSVSLERSHIDEALDTGKTPNIRWVQTPSPPARSWRKTYKMMGMAVFGGVFGGVAWAFLIELVLDRSVKRPTEIERKLKLPLFVSIPNVNGNGHTLSNWASERRQLTMNGGAGADAANGNDHDGKNGGVQVVSLEQNRLLQRFHQALRDRLILYFDIKNFTHKPKLVAVTGAGRGVGVSTVAAGLAASLSETGDGNVLLVDMNMENGAGQQFHRGKPQYGLDTVLADETKKNARVRDNLYVVNGTADTDGVSQALPTRFTTLVPKLKASQYDYIIFDMPVASANSVTSHLARFMDITLLVVESEKTGREIVEQANARLTELGATVGVVLNKTRQYVPKRLNQEFLTDK